MAKSQYKEEEKNTDLENICKGCKPNNAKAPKTHEDKNRGTKPGTNQKAREPTQRYFPIAHATLVQPTTHCSEWCGQRCWRGCELLKHRLGAERKWDAKQWTREQHASANYRHSTRAQRHTSWRRGPRCWCDERTLRHSSFDDTLMGGEAEVKVGSHDRLKHRLGVEEWEW